MTPIAIVVMVASMTILWGGLALSLLRLRRHPEVPPDDGEDD